MSDVNLTLQDNGGVYLAITETPAVVTLGAAVISGALASSVTVTNVVSVSVVTMPAINITPVAVTTVAGTVSVSNFPASSSVTIANFPSVTTVTGTVALDQASLIALENVTVTVGSTVSISNLPATQTIAGTVTANVPAATSIDNQFANLYGYNEDAQKGSAIPIGFNDTDANIFYNVSNQHPLPITNDNPKSWFQIKITDPYGRYSGIYVFNGHRTPFNPDAEGGSAYGPTHATFNDLKLAYVDLSTYGQNLGTRWAFIDSDIIVFYDDNNETDIRNADFNEQDNYIVEPWYSVEPVIITGLNNEPLPIRSPNGISINNSVTIGSLPAISGTVTASVTNSVTVGSLPVQFSTTTIGGTSRLNVTLSSATTVGATAPSYGNLSGGSDGTNFRAILTDTSGRTVVTVSNFPTTQPVSLASLPSLAAGTAQIGSVTASISGTVPVSGTFWQATQPVSGTVTAAVASTTVTVSAMPSGTLTTRFGTPTTANTAFLTSAVTNTARKYLLIQNVTTASNVITVGVGFVPTTTQGIQLAAGAGITFESSYIPTGAVWVLSSVTASNHTILEA